MQSIVQSGNPLYLYHKIISVVLQCSEQGIHSHSICSILENPGVYKGVASPPGRCGWC